MYIALKKKTSMLQSLVFYYINIFGILSKLNVVTIFLQYWPTFNL